MATEKLRAELLLITKKAEKDLERFDRKLSKVDKKVRDLGGKGGAALRPLGTGLSNATANASEFEKSMAAANARVIAFGASAGLVLQISRALKATVTATREVEKALMDINIVLNTSQANLQKFGNQLFKIAAQTGQSFQTIAVGATELARQGLGTEKTLSRLNDAMILSRLTGMGAEEAVKNLTAAVNSFNKSGITSAQVINKMAKVDQAFAVSSDDLAKAISRVGSSAVDAGVSMDELMAITTAVQQRTARGGAVIGNAFKTIFTRIGRTDVQKKLNAIGVETRDMQGHMLGATKVLENLASKFGTLGQMQQNQLAESVAGVFQVNILRATLGDLSSKYGVYTRALKISASATDEAYKKNERLNETLDALVNKTLANLTKLGAGIGGAVLEPAITRVLGLVNSTVEAFGEGGRFEEFGKGLGKDLLTGLGNFIKGPGLIILTVGIAKLAINFAAFAKTAVAGVLELNKGVLARKNLEDQVTAALMKQPAIMKQIERGEISAATAAKDMLATMRMQNMQADKLRITTAAIAGSMMGMGAAGSRFAGRGGGRASGFIPNFTSADGERTAAAMGGYKAGGIKSMSIPGQGSVMYNGAETVKRFPGFTQPAIMPPKKSFAGTNYKSAFGAAHGFDPYAGSGFVPNFQGWLKAGAVRPTNWSSRGSTPNYVSTVGATKGLSLEAAIGSGRFSRAELSGGFGKEAVDARKGMVSVGGKPVTKGDVVKETLDLKGQLGIVSLYGKGKTKAVGRVNDAQATMSVGKLGVFKEYVKKNPHMAKEKIRFTGIQVSTLQGLEETLKKGKKGNFSELINKHLISPLADIGGKLVGSVLGNQADPIPSIKDAMKGRRLLPKQSEGELFETAIKLALHKKTRFMQAIGGSDRAPFDFEEASSPTKTFKEKLNFGKRLLRADAKRTADPSAINSLIKKAYNQHVLIEGGLAKGPLLKDMALPMTGKINQADAFQRIKGTMKKPGGAHGFIPNFMRPFGGKGNVGPGGSARAVGSILGLNMKPSMIRKMLSEKNVKGILSKKDAFMGSRTGRSMTKMLKSLVEGWSRGLPLSVWILESIGLYGKAAVTNAMKMAGNLTKGQKIGAGIAFGQGFVPNYSSLGDALGRERAAGVPSSAIRIGSSPALASSANPGGLGVYNTIDEPAGLGQGISRSRGMGIDPKSHGAARGFVPNFPIDWYDRHDRPIPPSDPRIRPSKKPVPLSPSFFEAYDKDLKMREAEERSRRDTASSKRSLESSKKFAANVEKFNAGVGSFMMGATMIGYMAGPSLNRALGREPGDTKFQNQMMGGYMGQMIGGAAGGLAGGMGKYVAGGGYRMWGSGAAAQRQAGMFRGIMGGPGASAARVGGIRIAAGRTMAAAGKMMPHPGARLALTAAGMGLGAWGGGAMGEESPWDKDVRKRRGGVTEEMEKAQGFFGAAEAFSTGLTGLVSNYESLTGPQRAEQFKGVSESFSKMLPELPEDKEKDIRSAFVELKRALVEGDDIEKAEVKLSEALNKVAVAMDEVRESAEGTAHSLDIQEAAVKHSGLGGSLIGERDPGKMIGKTGGTTVRTPVYENSAFSRWMKQAAAHDANTFMELLGKVTPNWLWEGNFIRSDTTPEAPISYTDTYEPGTGPVGLLEPGKKFVDFASGKLMPHVTAMQQALAQQVQMLGPKTDEQFRAEEAYRAKSGGLLVAEEQMKEFRIQQKINALKEKGLVSLRDLTYRGPSGDILKAFPEKGALDELTISGKDKTGMHSVIQEAIMDEMMSKLDPTMISLWNTVKSARPERKDRVPLIKEFLKMQRGARVREAGRKEKMTLFTKEQAMKETTRAGISSLGVRLAASQGGEFAGLEAQRQADIAKSEARRDQAIAAARMRAELKTESVQDLFTKGLGEAGASKKFLDALPTDMGNKEAKKIITEQYDDLKKLFEKPMTLESFEKVNDAIATMSEQLREPGMVGEGAATLAKKLADLKSASLEAEKGMLDLSTTTDTETEAHKKLLPHINEMADETLRVTKALKLFSATAMNVARAENVRVAKSKVEALKGVKGVTGAEQAAADTELRRAEIAAGGGFQGLGGLTGAFKYNANDAALEFEEGMVDVGNTIKSSLKTAIKNIVSGADSFDDAMFNVFATLADKLADQGISMGVNSLFGMFGGSKGGMVPRGYNKGGMVQGGSGVRDDVLTYMQGGEYVIRKSAVNNIPGGEATLNAINGGNARGGLIPSYPRGGKANVSLAKEFLFDDPKRPTSGGYNVSGALSTSGLFREDDPQTENTIGKQAKFVRYQAYRQREQQRRDKIIEDIERQKKGRLYNAYLSAALRVGAGALSGAGNTTPTSTGGGGDPSGWGGYGAGAGSTSAGTYPTRTPLWGGTDAGSASGGYIPGFASGGPARVMGGEYIMSAGATAQHGTAFMSQLNRGRLPGFQEGGLVGGGGAAMAAGITTNNVNLSINIDKAGGAEVSTEKSGKDRNKNDERSTSEEAEDSKKLAEGIRNAVLKEIITQQRPGGLLRDGASASGLRTGG